MLSCSRLESEYKANPYHNALHAADVTQGMYAFAYESKLLDSLEDIEVFGGIVAAAAHGT